MRHNSAPINFQADLYIYAKYVNKNSHINFIPDQNHLIKKETTPIKTNKPNRPIEINLKILPVVKKHRTKFTYETDTLTNYV